MPLKLKEKPTIKWRKLCRKNSGVNFADVKKNLVSCEFSIHNKCMKMYYFLLIAIKYSKSMWHFHVETGRTNASLKLRHLPLGKKSSLSFCVGGPLNIHVWWWRFDSVPKKASQDILFTDLPGPLNSKSNNLGKWYGLKIIKDKIL